MTEILRTGAKAHDRMTWVLALILTVLLLAVSSCSEGKRPFETARVCLGNKDDVDQFTDLLRVLARSENMEFFDRSAQTLEERKALPPSNPDIRTDEFVLNVAVRDTSGMGVSASDLAGAHFQIALGFSEGANRPAAERFAASLIGKLKQRWAVDVYSDGAGVEPAAKCEKPQLRL